MNVLCRGCRTELDASADICSVCLRPRNRAEMAEDARLAEAAEARAARLPYVLAFWVLVLTGVAWVAMNNREQLERGRALARIRFQQLMEKASDPKTWAPKGMAGRAGGSAPASTDPRWRLPPRGYELSDYGTLVRGFVYDASTASPLPYARLQFADRAGGPAREIRADQRGYYELVLNHGGDGVLAAAAVPGYRPEPLAETDPPWHQRPDEERKSAASLPSTRLLLPLEAKQREALVNIVLVPAGYP